MSGIKVLEQFHSFQGEGKSIGRPAFFYRLAGCNFRCSWCDSKYSWRVNEKELVRFLPPPSDTKTELIVITGGEPLWKDNGNRQTTKRIIDALRCKFEIEVETNGIFPPLLRHSCYDKIRYVVSPKIDAYGDKYTFSVIKKFKWLGSIFKFVVDSEKQLEMVDVFCRTMDIPNNLVWIMPKGTEKEELIRTATYLVPHVLAYGYNLSLRLHRLIDCR